MVRAFQFTRLPDIIFRNGSISELPGIIAKFKGPVILVTGKSSFMESAHGQELLQSIHDKSISYFHAPVPAEPSPALIDEIAQRHRDENIRVVVAVGGGSVLDAGKAVSAMLTVSGSVKEYLEGVGDKEHPGTKVPFIAIPTTSGTGSEATKNAVISETGPNGFKNSLRHNHFVPDIALLDPELTVNCPPGITAAGGMDCFTQLTESFLSGNASVYTDAFCRPGLKAVKNSLLQAFQNGGNIEARSGMSFAALNSGICLANAGLGTVHGFASAIGGKFEIPHGLVCGTLMAATNRVNVRELRKKDPDGDALKKYTELGKIFLEKEGKPDDFYIDGFIDYLYQMTSDLQLSGLSSYGIKKEHIPEISSISGNKNNPVNLGQEEKEEILSEIILK